MSKKHTRIDELPDLHDDNPTNFYTHDIQSAQAQPMYKPRAIRNRGGQSDVPLESGMNINYPKNSGTSLYDQPFTTTNENGYEGGEITHTNFDTLNKHYQPTIISESYEHPSNPNECNCKYIYEHIKNCDICKRFYKPDTTAYLIIILILIIACSMMAKKLFNF